MAAGTEHVSTWVELLPFYEELQAWADEHLRFEPLDEKLAALGLNDGHVDVRPLLYQVVVLALLAVLGLLFHRKVRRSKDALLPDDRLSLRWAFETLTEVTYEAMAGLTGREAAKRFLPLIGTCAFVILLSNLFGLIPGMGAPTGALNVTFAAGLVVFAATHVYGVREHGLGPYLRHFLGPVGFWRPSGGALRWIGALGVNALVLVLMALLGLIESISHLVRPVTLGVRLTANMTADHTVLELFTGFGPASVLFAWVFYFMGALVCVVQTMVFCLLSMVYIAMAVAHEEH